MIKVGNACHVSTLPNNVFPVDIALGIQEIKAGNDVTTEDDEEDKHEILLDAGSLSPTEENALHSDISSRCSGSAIKKSVENAVTNSQGQDLKNGGIIFLKSNPSKSNCELQVLCFLATHFSYYFYSRQQQQPTLVLVAGDGQIPKEQFSGFIRLSILWSI